MDETFKVVDKPFHSGQLMSIHGFVITEEEIKQVPLLFVLMSCRRKEDYIAVLQKVKDVLNDFSVEGFMMDFEAASWGAVEEVFPGTQITGCVFQWSQSVYRQVKSLGLVPAFMAKGSIWDYVRKLLALPFLPHNHIENLFQQLAARANTEPLRNLVEYIDTQWIRSNVFPIQSWCVLKHMVRTNNNAEGWHTRLNGDCGNRALTFYKVVPALRKQAQEAQLDIEQLLQHGIGWRQRKVYRTMDTKIWNTWNDYSVQKIKSTELLKIISRVYGAAEYQ